MQGIKISKTTARFGSTIGGSRLNVQVLEKLALREHVVGITSEVPLEQLPDRFREAVLHQLTALAISVFRPPPHNSARMSSWALAEALH